MLFAVIFIGFFILLFLSAKEITEKRKWPFAKMAVYLYKRYCIFCMGKGRWRQKIKPILCPNQVMRNLQMLYPGKNAERLQAQYYADKCEKVMLILFVGNLLALILWINQGMAKGIVDGILIQREQQGGNSREKILRIYREDGYTTERTLHIKPARYGKAELEELYNQMTARLHQVILADNESIHYITEDIYLPQKLDGFPFLFQWSTDNYALLDSEGSLTGKLPDSSGEKVTVTALITYGDFEKEYAIPIVLCPPKMTEEQKWEESLTRELEISDRLSEYEQQWKLPVAIEGQKVYFKEKKEKDSNILFLLAFTASAAVFLMQDKDLDKKVQQRQREIMEEYAVLVSKMVLFLGAGMTVRGAWQKIAYDYKKRAETKKNAMYEEMLYTCHQMENGVSESIAYERFGTRCRLQACMKLGTLLSQNLKKGNRMLLIQLKEEATAALEEKKNTIRQKGEEINTKLLAPMMLLLGMIMVWIMVPAVSVLGG